MKQLLVGLAWLALALPPSLAATQTQEVVNLPTRPGITQRMLVIQPEKPAGVLVLMTGGNGRIGIHENGSLRFERNFLVRSRALFVQQGFAVVLLDTPSDHSGAPFLDGSFRGSDEHAADIGAAIAWARQRFGTKVWLAGTSRGTQSVANAGIALSGPSAPDGLVLSSTILASGRFERSSVPPVQAFPLEKLKLPVLVAHHEQDQCQVCPPSLLPVLMARLPAASSRLITYQGGRSVGGSCEALAHHGYNGIEDQVVGDITAWIAGQPR